MSGNLREPVCCCGLSCDACGIYQGKLKDAAENLRTTIRTFGIDSIALKFVSLEPAFAHYAEFEKVLDGFTKLFANCQGCSIGDGDPHCVIRECCQQKAHNTCIECYDLDDCDKLKTRVLLHHCVMKTLEAKNLHR